MVYFTNLNYNLIYHGYVAVLCNFCSFYLKFPEIREVICGLLKLEVLLFVGCGAKVCQPCMQEG